MSLGILAYRHFGAATWQQGYGAYVALLYGMVTLLAVNIGLCVWVAWCFKEQKFPVVWPIKVSTVS